jgi:hypothetical protein
MRRMTAIAILAATFGGNGCGGDGDADDVAEVKKILPIDQVPAVVMKKAKDSAPELIFFKAYTGKYQGKDSFEIVGKTKSGKIKELEIAPDGTLLGTE